MTTPDHRQLALTSLLALHPDMWQHLAPHLTCDEAATVAAFLTAYDVMPVTDLIAAHAAGDEEGDTHHQVRVDDDSLTHWATTGHWLPATGTCPCPR